MNALTAILETHHGSNQTIIDVLGARLITNQLFAIGPEETSVNGQNNGEADESPSNQETIFGMI